MPVMKDFPDNRIGILIGSLEVGGAQVMALRLMQMLIRKGTSVFFIFLWTKHLMCRFRGMKISGIKC